MAILLPSALAALELWARDGYTHPPLKNLKLVLKTIERFENWACLHRWLHLSRMGPV